MVRAEDVISIYQSLLADDIQVWLTGGWGIDALLREQTRPHKDLDVIMLVDDVVRMRELLDGDGYGLKELWSENRWVVDARGAETATAFVLQDAEGREIDAHAMRLDDQGNGFPAWEAEGLVFERQDLAGEGMIAGFAVRCLAPEMQMLRHTGYELPDGQLRDLELLHERFGVEYPDEHPRAVSAPASASATLRTSIGDNAISRRYPQDVELSGGRGDTLRAPRGLIAESPLAALLTGRRMCDWGLHPVLKRDVV